MAIRNLDKMTKSPQDGAIERMKGTEAMNALEAGGWVMVPY